MICSKVRVRHYSLAVVILDTLRDERRSLMSDQVADGQGYRITYDVLRRSILRAAGILWG